MWVPTGIKLSLPSNKVLYYLQIRTILSSFLYYHHILFHALSQMSKVIVVIMTTGHRKLYSHTPDVRKPENRPVLSNIPVFESQMPL